MDSFEAFISYRRQGGKELAESLPGILEEEYGISSFLDNEALHFGDFRTQLVRNNLISRVLIVLLSPGALDRCKNEGDWVAREIGLFLRFRKPIMLIEFEGFTFPEDLPENLQRIKTMPTIPYAPGQPLGELARQIVMVLRQRWVRQIDGEAFATLVKEQLPLCHDVCTSDAAERITKQLLRAKHITKDEVPTVQNLMLPVVEGETVLDIHAETLKIVRALENDRLQAVVAPAKVAREAAGKDYGDLVENHDKDTLVVRQLRAQRVAPFFGYLVMLIVLIGSYLFPLEGIQRFLPPLVVVPILLFCEKRGRFDELFAGGLKGKLIKLIGSIIGGGLLYVFIPLVLLALLCVIMMEHYEYALAVILLSVGMVAMSMCSLTLVYRAIMRILELINTWVNFHFSTIYLGQLSLDRSRKYAKPVGWVLFVVVTALSIWGSIQLLKGGLQL